MIQLDPIKEIRAWLVLTFPGIHAILLAEIKKKKIAFG